MSEAQKKMLALIPARGGSKGLPNKNVLELNGKPLIAWTIEAALNSPLVSDVVVTTDDNAIAETALKWGANVPFKRPGSLAQDDSSSMSVILHALDYFETKQAGYQSLVLLQPTSPLRLQRHIDEAINLFEEKNANAVISVTESDHPKSWMNQLPADLCMKDFIQEEDRGKNRQELGTFYQLNGAIYVANCRYIQESQDWFSDQSYAYVMDRCYSIDIDSREDAVIADAMMKYNGG